MNKKEASKITGGLSAPGKMPEGSYNLPAQACQTGAKLRQVPGTPCSGCYALKGRYNFPNVKDALSRRLGSLGHPRWVQAMAVLIKGKKFFRWHDSGDIQSEQHLINIFEVCKLTPETQHWLPTQERKFLPLSGSTIPKNLIIRLSNAKNDTKPGNAWDALVHCGDCAQPSWFTCARRLSRATAAVIAARAGRRMSKKFNIKYTK